MQKYRFEIFTALVCLFFFLFQREILLTYSLDPDEIFSWSLATGSMTELFPEIIKHCQQFVFYLALKMWMLIVPNNDYWVRLPVVFAGVGTIITLIFLARRTFGEKHLFIRSIIFFLYPQFVFYSNYGRPYAFLILFISLNLLFLQKVYFSKESKKRDLHLFFISLILVIFTHHVGFIYFAAVIVGLVLLKKKIGTRIELIPYELLLVGYFIVLITQKSHMAAAVSWIKPLTLSEIPSFLIGNKLYVIFYFLPLISLFKKGKDEFQNYLLILIGLFILGIAMASLLITPLFVHRHFYLLFPAIYILTLYGAELIEKQKPYVFFILFLYLLEGGSKLYTDKIHFSSRLDTKHFLKYLNQHVEVKNGFHCIQKGGAASLIKNYSYQYYKTNICKSSSHQFEGKNVLLVNLKNEKEDIPSDYKKIYQFQKFSVFQKN